MSAPPSRRAAAACLASSILAVAACLALLAAGPWRGAGAGEEDGGRGAGAGVRLSAASPWASFEDAGDGTVSAVVGAVVTNEGGADALAVAEVELSLRDLALRSDVASAAVPIGRRLAPGESAEVSAAFSLDGDAYAAAGAVGASPSGRAASVRGLPVGEAVSAVTRAKAGLEERRARAAAEAAAAEPRPEPEPEPPSSSSSSSAETPAAAGGGTWAARLDAYLEGSPMAGLGGALARAAAASGTDPRLSAAVAAVETGKGARCRRAFDAWNWGGESWGSWEAAVAAHEAAMASAYGSDPLSAMAAATRAGDASWEASVRAQMELI